MVIQTDLVVGDGRTLHAYDAVADGARGRLAVFWHHGTPNVGAPPEPLFPAAARLGLRWVSYDRPATVGQRRIRVGMWPRWPSTWPASPTRWASSSSR